jgi:ribosomal protein S18 acetylase RimI-like enzyme
VTTIRRFRTADAPVVWALNDLPNVGATADPAVPLPLPPATAPPAAFADLADIEGTFLAAGGEFLVAQRSGHLVGMGGFRPDAAPRDGRAGAGRAGDRRAEVLRVRVHPATRRLGGGRARMGALERRAAALGITVLHLDTATNQPEAMAFYASLGYRETGRAHRPGWTWTLVYYAKDLASPRMGR